MTGAAIPKGCDCCVRQEDTDYGEETVRIFRPTGQWQNYCYQGENFKNGTVLLKKGDKIGFIEAGILASMGVIKVKVYRRVRAAVLTIGDEVMAPGKRLIPGKIYDCNQGLLAVRMKEFGAELVEVAAIEDRPQAMTAAESGAGENFAGKAQNFDAG
ncbi:MAG: molybdopterin-binding protein [Blautia obeum]